MKKVKIREVAEQIRGVSYTPADAFDAFSGNTIPLLRANNIQNLTANYNDLVYVRADKVGSKQLLKINDILICASSGSKHLVGKACVIKKEYGTFGAFCKVLRPNAQMINPAYFSHYFQSAIYRKTISELAAGANINNIKNEHLDELAIALPDMPTQEGIARKLDAICRLITLRKQQLQKLDQLASSRFVEMFGDLAAPHCKWQKEMLIDSCPNSDDIKCGPFGTQLNKEEYRNSGVAVWEIPQINSGFMTSPTHYLTAEKASQLEAYSLIPGDIAMSRKGNVGKCAIFPAYFQPGIIHSDVLRIRLDQRRVSPVFMMYQLHISGAVQHQIELVSSGAIMAGINVTKLKKIYVHLPPLELQNKFAAFIEQLDKSKVTIRKSIEKLETTYRALLQEYFG